MLPLGLQSTIAKYLRKCRQRESQRNKVRVQSICRCDLQSRLVKFRSPRQLVRGESLVKFVELTTILRNQTTWIKHDRINAKPQVFFTNLRWHQLNCKKR